MTLGETMHLGPYVVRCSIRADNPYFPSFLVFLGEQLIGRQFSQPSESDCRWHDKRRGQFATAAESKKDSSWQLRIPSRRGRPTNAERARRAVSESGVCDSSGCIALPP
jgi:hypothetical protein